jgi:hypothetical protein
MVYATLSPILRGHLTIAWALPKPPVMMGVPNPVAGSKWDPNHARRPNP